MTKSFIRGHPIFFENGEWLYCDTKTPTIGSSRPCGYCGENESPEGHDKCLGTLPGVNNACCGHGQPGEAYVQFSGGSVVGGAQAIATIENLKIQRG